MRIGITDCFKEDNYQAYVDWITGSSRQAEVVKLSYVQNTPPPVAALDGLVLTGGGDVHPKHYGMEKQLGQMENVNEQRDEFEFDVIEAALDAEIPVFGICRGMQVMNVFLGGTLIADLETEGYDRHTASQTTATEHRISIHPYSLLGEIAANSEVSVNSYHHQAVGHLGRGLMAAATSSDGVIEAAEWALKERMPFLMLVQWHPERSRQDAFSKALAAVFLREVERCIRQKATP